ncbi:hypothetical protein CFC21_106325 [Triticum aestivum]|uniref:Uncharacterized protein n=2 Tax=Triticum aestivum TaxID=4565 RepID=A0A9R1N9F9_WHEAT|nr:hypothetical protein CFC21_106325 [Triticum aestivum]
MTLVEPLIGSSHVNGLNRLRWSDAKRNDDSGPRREGVGGVWGRLEGQYGESGHVCVPRGDVVGIKIGKVRTLPRTTFFLPNGLFSHSSGARAYIHYYHMHARTFDLVGSIGLDDTRHPRQNKPAPGRARFFDDRPRKGTTRPPVLRRRGKRNKERWQGGDEYEWGRREHVELRIQIQSRLLARSKGAEMRVPRLTATTLGTRINGLDAPTGGDGALLLSPPGLLPPGLLLSPPGLLSSPRLASSHQQRDEPTTRSSGKCSASFLSHDDVTGELEGERDDPLLRWLRWLVLLLPRLLRVRRRRTPAASRSDGDRDSGVAGPCGRDVRGGGWAAATQRRGRGRVTGGEERRGARVWEVAASRMGPWIRIGRLIQTASIPTLHLQTAWTSPPAIDLLSSPLPPNLAPAMAAATAAAEIAALPEPRGPLRRLCGDLSRRVRLLAPLLDDPSASASPPLADALRAARDLLHSVHHGSKIYQVCPYAPPSLPLPPPPPPVDPKD